MFILNRKKFSHIVFCAALPTLFVFTWLQFNHGHNAHDYLMAHIGEAYAVTHDQPTDVPLHETERFTDYEYQLLSPFHCEFLTFFSQQYDLDHIVTPELPEIQTNSFFSPTNYYHDTVVGFHIYLRAPPLS